MPKRIIFQNDNGGVSVVIPSPDFLGMLKTEVAATRPEYDKDIILDIMHFIAKKDVPADKPYKIIDTSYVPTDRTFRDAWEADFTAFDGVGGTE